MRFFVGSLALSLGMIWPSLADASCGLDQCPSDWVDGRESTTTLTSMTRYTGVADGFYIEEFVGLRRALPWNLRAGFALPVLHVEQAGSSYSGLGNLVAVVDYVPFAKSARGYALGIQAELPTASAPQLGDGHMVALPYARGWYGSKSWDVRVQLGWGYTLEGGDHHHHHHGHSGSHDESEAVSWVNPHSDSELLSRGSFGFMVYSNTTLRAGFDAVVELGSGDQLFQGTFGAEYQGQQLTIAVVGEVPMTKLRRHDNRARLTLGWRL